jgi:hypothetical protein
MKKHYKKMIAPITIILIIVCYYLIIGGALLSSRGIPLPLKIAGLAIPAALIGVGVYVVIERIKEIRSGEEDDLSKY